jgi:O-antigen ligase
MADTSRRYSRLIQWNEIFHHPVFWKGLIVLVILTFTGIASFLLGTDSQGRLLVVAIALPLVILGTVFILNTWEQSALVIILIAAFVPFGLSTGTDSKVMLSMILSAAYVMIWILHMLGVEKRIHFTPSAINRPLFGFVIISVLSLIWSNVFRDPAVRVTPSFPLVQAASTAVMVLLPLSALLVANSIHKEKTLRWMVGLILVVGVLDLGNRFAGLNLPINANGITQMWVIAFAISIFFFMKNIPRKLRVIMLLIAAASILWGFVLHIDWLAGWLPGFIVLGVISFIKSKKLFAFLVVAAVILFVLNANFYDKSINSEQTTSGDTRLAAWSINWQVTSQHILFGTGPGGYAAYYMTYYPTQAMATHSNYIDIFAETGVIGFAFYIWLFGSLVWLGLRLLRRLRGRGDFLEAATVAILAGTIGCIVIMGFGDWLIPFAYTQTIAGFNYEVYSWLFLGALVVIERLTDPAAELAKDALLRID